MEAALSVLVMSYIPDMLSPTLMLCAACVTFFGANNFSPRATAICRPILGLNVIYHLYLVARLVHMNEGSPLFDDDHATARSVLLSLGCIVIMELVALRKSGLFYLRLRLRSPSELDRLRALRRARGGWLRRFVVLSIFMLICTPVLARSLLDELCWQVTCVRMTRETMLDELTDEHGGAKTVDAMWSSMCPKFCS